MVNNLWERYNKRKMFSIECRERTPQHIIWHLSNAIEPIEVNKKRRELYLYLRYDDFGNTKKEGNVKP